MTLLRLYDLFQYTVSRALLRSSLAVWPDQLFGPAYGNSIAWLNDNIGPAYRCLQ